uniref:C-type lectin domain-containing protein n=1 Tax=Caenorhabditis japonica TaxID=281687 RepID=A0A8R1EJV5_CAEJA
MHNSLFDWSEFAEFYTEYIIFVFSTPTGQICTKLVKYKSGRQTTCPKDWKRFERPSGGWCMQVFRQDNTDFFKSIRFCQEKDAVPSGIQNVEERDWITKTATNVIGASSGSIWIGAVRNPQCVGKKLSATCSQKTAFEWGEISVSGTAGFTWLDSSQPDNAHGSTQNCIVLFASAKTVKHKNVDWWPGALDDVSCTPSEWDNPGPRALRGVVCGRFSSDNDN